MKILTYNEWKIRNCKVRQYALGFGFSSMTTIIFKIILQERVQFVSQLTERVNVQRTHAICSGTHHLFQHFGGIERIYSRRGGHPGHCINERNTHSFRRRCIAYCTLYKCKQVQSFTMRQTELRRNSTKYR